MAAQAAVTTAAAVAAVGCQSSSPPPNKMLTARHAECSCHQASHTRQLHGAQVSRASTNTCNAARSSPRWVHCQLQQGSRRFLQATMKPPLKGD